MSAKTPDWMVERLRRCGMRSINPIVDVRTMSCTNSGQPMHAFDLAKISGGIVFEWRKRVRNTSCLTAVMSSSIADNLVIADHKKAIALAGIMGGDNSAISAKTSDIYLEAAFFSPEDYMLGKAREFGMHTDASHRFERGVDFQLQLAAMERATGLVVEIAGGIPGPVTHANEKTKLAKIPTIKFQKAQLHEPLELPFPMPEPTAFCGILVWPLKPQKRAGL